MNQSSPAEYEALTKQHYQDSAVAENYWDEYAGPFTLRSLPARLVALRERQIIHDAIADIVKHDTTPVRKVLDLPCGTGKLASVLAPFDFSVVAADISQQMMDVAAREYRNLHSFVGFKQTDASATTFADREFDAVLCLRLLHRVPDTVRSAILSELSRISRKHVVVSVGLTDSLQERRRQARRLITGTMTVPYPVTRSVFTSQLAEAGLIPVRWASVLPLLSSEWIVVSKKVAGR